MQDVVALEVRHGGGVQVVSRAVGGSHGQDAVLEARGDDQARVRRRDLRDGLDRAGELHRQDEHVLFGVHGARTSYCGVLDSCEVHVAGPFY